MCLEIPLIAIIYLVQVWYLFLQVFFITCEALKASCIIAKLAFQFISFRQTWIKVVSCIVHHCRGVSSDEKQWDEAISSFEFTLFKCFSLFRICVCLASVNACFESAVWFFEFDSELVRHNLDCFIIEFRWDLLVFVLRYWICTFVCSGSHWIK